ncbi:MAG: B12-binding domain-containing radical SAM protein [Deltaproteobacteria bacterium]
MTDIVLFNPYYSQPRAYYAYIRPTVPLNLLYLASYLRETAGLTVRIHDLGVFHPQEAQVETQRVRFGLPDKAIRDILLRERPRIVGITCMYSLYFRDVLAVARLTKETLPETSVVLGGNHASSYWEHILKDASVDYVVIGEGEATLLELARRLLEGRPALDIQGVAFRRGSAAVRTQARPLIGDLDTIPFPAYDLIDYPRYLEKGNPFAMRAPAAGVVTSRGCPGECVYCTVKAVWGRTWRGRSPGNVVDEIALLKERYGIGEFAVLDDSASVDRRRWEGFCAALIDRRLNLKWTTPNGIAHWTLSPALLDLMRQAGCYRITFGIESGDPGTRRFLGKPYPLEQARQLIGHANRIGLWTISTNILGFPYEERSSLEATLRFAKESGTDFACFYLLQPQPTSEVYKAFRAEGLLNFDAFFQAETFDEKEFERINEALNETGCSTTRFTQEELGRFQKSAYRSFLLHRGLAYLIKPWRLLWKIHDAEDLRYVLRLTGKAMSIFFRTFNPLFRKSSDYIYASTTARVAPEEK